VADIPFAHLAVSYGVNYYCFDKDNTLCPLGESEPDQETVAAILAARRDGYIKGICIVSNIYFPSHSREQRLRECAELLGAKYVSCIYPDLKPKVGPFNRAMALMGATPDTTAMVGDQYLIDIRGGNRAGILTVKIDPVGSDHFSTIPKRVVERYLFRHYVGDSIAQLHMEKGR
jgi:hypothetical protein